MLKEVNSSQFHMWRSVVALVLADGLAHPEEEKFLRESFAKLPLNEEQRSILEQDLSQPKDVHEMFSKIEKPADRSQLIYFARLLFWSDGDFHHQEKAILAKLRGDTLAKSDLEGAMKEVEGIAIKFYEDEEKRKSGFKGKVMSLVDVFLGES